MYHLFKSVATKMSNFKEIEWNRFAPYHGRSPCDAHFSVLSRWLKMIEHKVIVKDTKTLLEELLKCTNQSEKVSTYFFELGP